MRKDILTGAFFAVLIMYFVILATGTILHDHGIYKIDSIKDAAIALKPLAGNFSYLIFSLGLIGTGFLIIMVLSTSISYILTEAFNLKSGLSNSPREAKLFYVIIGIAMCLGVAMHWLGISSVKALLFTTMLYGITTPFLISIILLISNNKKIMGKFRNGLSSNIAGIGILVLMLTTLVALGFLLFIH